MESLSLRTTWIDWLGLSQTRSRKALSLLAQHIALGATEPNTQGVSVCQGENVVENKPRNTITATPRNTIMATMQYCCAQTVNSFGLL